MRIKVTVVGIVLEYGADKRCEPKRSQITGDGVLNILWRTTFCTHRVIKLRMRWTEHVARMGRGNVHVWC